MELFSLVGKIVIDNAGANSAIDSTISKVSGLANGIGGTLSKVGGVAGTAVKAVGTAAVAVGKTVAAGAAAGATAVGALTKQSVQAYADYEQLVGGVETLFEDLSYDVIQYADEAYKTAGLSANDYMETVTSFAASLNQSLKRLNGNIAQSADMANMAIIDMSDNANKMGTDMSMIQNAYQGFAKQNYTMLDNLKLGYGGTQAEMYRLMSDAKKLDETFDAEFSLSAKGTLEAEFADILQAIHIIQTEMGITGTTRDEAASTISGSLASTKAAWENLLVGFADPNQDIGQLTKNLVSSGVTFAQNLLPRIGEAIPGIVEGVKEMAPLISEAFDEHVVPMVSEGLSGALGAIGIDVKPEKITESLENIKKKVGESLGGLKQIVSNNSDELGELTGSMGGLFGEVSELVQQVDWDAVFGGLIKGVKAVTDALTDGVSGVNDFINSVKALSDEHGVVGAFFKTIADGTNPINRIPSLEDLGISENGAPDVALEDYINKNAPFAGNVTVKGPKIEFDYSQMTSNAQAARSQIESILSSGTITGPYVDFAQAVSGASSARHEIVSLLGGSITIPVLYEITTVETPTQAVANARIEASKKADATAAAAQYEANKAAASGDETAARVTQAVADARAEAASKAAAEAAAAVMQANKEAISSKNTKKNAKGAILNRATIFGKVGETYQIGGEAGAEAVAPIETLQNYVSTAVAEVMAGQNAATAEAFAASAASIVDRLESLADDIAEAMGRTRISINGREFGRLVREV